MSLTYQLLIYYYEKIEPHPQLQCHKIEHDHKTISATLNILYLMPILYEITFSIVPLTVFKFR